MSRTTAATSAAAMSSHDDDTNITSSKHCPQEEEEEDDAPPIIDEEHLALTTEIIRLERSILTALSSSRDEIERLELIGCGKKKVVDGLEKELSVLLKQLGKKKKERGKRNEKGRRRTILGQANPLRRITVVGGDRPFFRRPSVGAFSAVGGLNSCNEDHDNGGGDNLGGSQQLSAIQSQFAHNSKEHNLNIDALTERKKKLKERIVRRERCVVLEEKRIAKLQKDLESVKWDGGVEKGDDKAVEEKVTDHLVGEAGNMTTTSADVPVLTQKVDPSPLLQGQSSCDSSPANSERLQSQIQKLSIQIRIHSTYTEKALEGFARVFELAERRSRGSLPKDGDAGEAKQVAPLHSTPESKNVAIDRGYYKRRRSKSPALTINPSEESDDCSYYVGCKEEGFRGSTSIHESDISETDSEAIESTQSSASSKISGSREDSASGGELNVTNPLIEEEEARTKASTEDVASEAAVEKASESDEKEYQQPRTAVEEMDRQLLIGEITTEVNTQLNNLERMIKSLDERIDEYKMMTAICSEPKKDSVEIDETDSNTEEGQPDQLLSLTNQCADLLTDFTSSVSKLLKATIPRSDLSSPTSSSAVASNSAAEDENADDTGDTSCNKHGNVGSGEASTPTEIRKKIKLRELQQAQHHYDVNIKIIQHDIQSFLLGRQEEDASVKELLSNLQIKVKSLNERLVTGGEEMRRLVGSVEVWKERERSLLRQMDRR
ncbi:predicted protein [Thalassiosira pseudonana CCMP1335]|uniref:Uncharacterized protein n=1 Tax=Thalassiosira pseudonana TaxID=35128 RepID=B8C8I9_THAPS|nr:predicted protein [Thalassiosira pseudonana CCMP1335]EED90494.1 predicted protein [Thalassiosira pseudonana CCMP1335]